MNDEDWQLLNQFADDELSGDAKAKLNQRLAVEPSLARALADVRLLKDSIGQAYEAGFETSQAVAKTAVPPSWYPVRASLLGLVLLVIVTVWQWPDRAPAPLFLTSAIDIHQGYADRRYDLRSPMIEVSDHKSQLLQAGIPALEKTGLTLVELNAFEYQSRLGWSAHYSGSRGCRLTIVVVPVGNASPSLVSGAERLSRLWRTASYEYAIVADRMDALRFKAIGKLIEVATRRIQFDTLLHAASDVQMRARRCAVA